MREDRPSRFPSHICSKTEIVRPSHAHWAQRAHVRRRVPRKPGMQVIMGSREFVWTRYATTYQTSDSNLECQKPLSTMPGLHDHARLRCGWTKGCKRSTAVVCRRVPLSGGGRGGCAQADVLAHASIETSIRRAKRAIGWRCLAKSLGVSFLAALSFAHCKSRVSEVGDGRAVRCGAVRGYCGLGCVVHVF
jgi:hypothetical protein